MNHHLWSSTAIKWRTSPHRRLGQTKETWLYLSSQMGIFECQLGSPVIEQSTRQKHIWYCMREEIPCYLKKFKWVYWKIEAVDIWTAFGSKLLEYLADLMKYGYLTHFLIVLSSHFFPAILTAHPHLRRGCVEHGGSSLTVGGCE